MTGKEDIPFQVHKHLFSGKSFRKNSFKNTSFHQQLRLDQSLCFFLFRFLQVKNGLQGLPNPLDSPSRHYTRNAAVLCRYGLKVCNDIIFRFCRFPSLWTCWTPFTGTNLKLLGNQLEMSRDSWDSWDTDHNSLDFRHGCKKLCEKLGAKATWSHMMRKNPAVVAKFMFF